MQNFARRHWGKMNSENHSHNQLGYTLAELLMVVAIIAILAGVGFIAATTMIRNAKQTAADKIAESIFTAAQNQLTDLYAFRSSDLGKLTVPADAIEKGSAIENPALAGKTDDGVQLCFASISLGSSESAPFPFVLPKGSISEELRSKTIVVEYLPSSARVYAVYYSADAGSDFYTSGEGAFAAVSGGTYISEVQAAEGDDSDQNGGSSGTASGSANKLRDRDGRLDFAKETHQFVGYYQSDVQNLPAPADEVVVRLGDAKNSTKNRLYNYDELSADIWISVPKSVKSKSENVSILVNVEVAGVQSENKATTQIKIETMGTTGLGTADSICVPILLDSLKNKVSFADQFATKPTGTGNPVLPKDSITDNKNATIGGSRNDAVWEFESDEADGEKFLIPGEDITVTVSAEVDGIASSNTASATDNSLFAAGSGFGEDSTYSAYLAYGRHLQNLTSERFASYEENAGTLAGKSVVSPVVAAKQIKDIDFALAGEDSAKDSKDKDEIDRLWRDVYAESASAIRSFVPVANESVSVVYGDMDRTYGESEAKWTETRTHSDETDTQHTIRNLPIEVDDAGIFKYTSEGADFAGISVNANGSLGVFDTFKGMKIEYLSIENAVVTGGSSADAVGILAGNAGNGTVSIENCIIINSKVNSRNVANGIGGLAGVISASGGTTITNCTITDSEVSGSNAQEMGGLIGMLQGGGTVALSDCEVRDSKINGGNTVNSVGGLVGKISGSDSARITNCSLYMSNEQKTDEEGKSTDGWLTAWKDGADKTANDATDWLAGGTYVGGLVGLSESTLTIQNSFAATVVRAEGTEEEKTFAGGLVGALAAGKEPTVDATTTGAGEDAKTVTTITAEGNLTVNASYADCYISGKYIGGLAGACGKNSSFANCYSAGFALGEPFVAGGYTATEAGLSGSNYSLFNFDDPTDAAFTAETLTFDDAGKVTAYPADVPSTATAATKYAFVRGGTAAAGDGAYYSYGGSYAEDSVQGSYLSIADMMDANKADGPKLGKKDKDVTPYKLSLSDISDFSGKHMGVQGIPKFIASGTAGVHYGDWLERPQETDDAATPQVVYFEKYVKGGTVSYGLHTEGKDIGKAELKDAKTVGEDGIDLDGYGVLFAVDGTFVEKDYNRDIYVFKEDSTDPVVMTVGKTTSNSANIYLSENGSVVSDPSSNADSVKYVLRPFANGTNDKAESDAGNKDVVNINTDATGGKYYRKLTVSMTEDAADGAVWYYNPHFAKTAVKEAENATEENGNAAEGNENATKTGKAPETPDVIYIRSARQFYLLSVNFGAYRSVVTKNTTFSQEQHINYDKYNWEEGLGKDDFSKSQHPIGSDSESFQANYDGRCLIITGVDIETDAERSGQTAGVFGVNAGKLSNIVVVTEKDNHIYVDSESGAAEVGVLTGRNDGEVNNCAVAGYRIKKNDDAALRIGENGCVGGLVGKNGGKIINSSAVVRVMRIHTESGGCAGGLVGENKDGAKIESSYAVGLIRGDEVEGEVGTENADGGNTGSDNTSDDSGNDVTSGSATESDGGYIGGFVGRNGGTITGSYCTTAFKDLKKDYYAFGKNTDDGTVDGYCYYLTGTGKFCDKEYSTYGMTAAADGNLAGTAKSYDDLLAEEETTAVWHPKTTGKYPFAAYVRKDSDDIHYGDWVKKVSKDTIKITLMSSKKIRGELYFDTVNGDFYEDKNKTRIVTELKDAVIPTSIKGEKEFMGYYGYISGKPEMVLQKNNEGKIALPEDCVAAGMTFLKAQTEDIYLYAGWQEKEFRTTVSDNFTIKRPGTYLLLQGNVDGTDATTKKGIVLFTAYKSWVNAGSQVSEQKNEDMIQTYVHAAKAGISERFIEAIEPDALTSEQSVEWTAEQFDSEDYFLLYCTFAGDSNKYYLFARSDEYFGLVRDVSLLAEGRRDAARWKIYSKKRTSGGNTYYDVALQCKRPTSNKTIYIFGTKLSDYKNTTVKIDSYSGSGPTVLSTSSLRPYEWSSKTTSLNVDDELTEAEIAAGLEWYKPAIPIASVVDSVYYRDGGVGNRKFYKIRTGTEAPYQYDGLIENLDELLGGDYRPNSVCQFSVDDVNFTMTYETRTIGTEDYHYYLCSDMNGNAIFVADEDGAMSYSGANDIVTIEIHYEDDKGEMQIDSVYYFNGKYYKTMEEAMAASR